MRADTRLLREMFDRFNALCFEGSLPPVRIALSRSRRTLGQFRHRTVGTRRECDILISVCYDLPVEDIEDVLIHEMIHYAIWHRRIPDRSAHGPVFRRMMEEINTRHGRRLSISHKSTPEERETDTRSRANYLCITRWRDGRTGLTVCATTCIFAIRRAFLGDPRVEALEWRWSSDPWFNRFPRSRTAKAHILSAADYAARILPARPCTCTDKEFKLKGAE